MYGSGSSSESEMLYISMVTVVEVQQLLTFFVTKYTLILFLANHLK